MAGRGMASSLSRKLPAQREEPRMVEIRTCDGIRRNRRHGPLGYSSPSLLLYYLKWPKLKLMVVENYNDRTHWSSPARRPKFLAGSQKMQSMNSCCVYPLGIQWMSTASNEQIHWESTANLGYKKMHVYVVKQLVSTPLLPHMVKYYLLYNIYTWYIFRYIITSRF